MRDCNNYKNTIIIHDMKISLHDKTGIIIKSNINYAVRYKNKYANLSK